VTLQEPENPHSVESGIPDTEVIKVSSPAPVFVDSTGRRRRFLRRLAYGFGALCMLYGGLVSVSLAGGPVRSSAVLPLPDMQDDEPEVIAAEPVPQPTPAPPQSAAPPRPRLITEALRRTETRELRRAEAPRSQTPKPARTTATVSKTSPAKSSSPSPRPVESGTTAPPTGSASPSPEVPAPAPPPRVTPVPPVPPAGGTGGGTSDGGSGAGTNDGTGTGSGAGAGSGTGTGGTGGSAPDSGTDDPKTQPDKAPTGSKDEDPAPATSTIAAPVADARSTGSEEPA